MEIITLTEDNINLYTDYIGEDVAENIGRLYYRGLVADDGGMTKAAMIWDYKNLETEEDTESHISFFRQSDPDAARQMLEEYTKTAKADGVVKSYAEIPLKNGKQAKEILGEAGFEMKLSESDEIIVTARELLDMPLMKSRAIPKDIMLIRDVAVRAFRKGIAGCVSKGRKGLCEDLEDLSMNFFDENVSCCFERNGVLNSFLLFHKHPSGMLSIQLMISFDKELQIVLASMMKKFVIAMEEEYSPDTKVMLNRHNQASLMLTEKLLPRGFGIPTYAGSRQEK